MASDHFSQPCPNHHSSTTFTRFLLAMAFNRAGSRSGTAGDAYNTSASFAIPPASSYDELLLGTPNHQDFLRGMDHSFDNSDVVPRSSASPRKALGFIDLSQVTPRRRSPRKHRTPVRSQSRSRRSSPEKLAKILEMGDGQEDHNEGERQVQDKTDIPEDGLVVETTQGDSAVSASPELAISEPSPSKPSERESLRPKKVSIFSLYKVLQSADSLQEETFRKSRA